MHTSGIYGRISVFTGTKGFFVSPMIESVVTKPSHRAESKNSVENKQKDMQETAIGKGKKHWIADFLKTIM